MEAHSLNMNELLKLDCPLILASASPRRKKLLEQLGFNFTILPADIDENNLNGIPPVEHVKILANRKAESIAERISYPAIILAADTIVVLGDNIINKPINTDDAINMLKSLSGRTHTVYTGITLSNTANGRQITDYKQTDVTFRDLSESEIRAYVDTGSPMDKAGAYGIQDDFGAVFVNHIVGCYYNIVGLPLELLYSRLKEIQ